MHKIVDLPHSATQIRDTATSGEARDASIQGTGVFSIIRAEFRRALAAMRRYETLRYGDASREGIASTEIPRAIFDEFYASRMDSEPVKMNQYRNRRRVRRHRR
jgi:hypothetical protein